MVNLYAIISIYGMTAVSGANLFVLEASAINLMRSNVSPMPFLFFVFCAKCNYSLDHAKEKYSLQKKASGTEFWLQFKSVSD